MKPGHGVALLAGPNGRRLGVLGPRTHFGSPQVLPVVRSRGGRWLAVVSSALPNDRLGWLDAASRSLASHRVSLSLEDDLSRRLLLVRSHGRVVRSLRIGIGREANPTPTGRFSVTDKLNGPAYAPGYGCCILALSGREQHPPAGWSGDPRLAIHGGSTPGAVTSGSSTPPRAICAT
ncbi:MAG TPA: L,D-transpeptidase [Gaiellaceae bacterium]